MPPSDDGVSVETRTLDFESARQLLPGADHYRAYVGPPDRFDFMGATQFALLFSLGLRDHHRILDFGCGSLRLGRLLIPFLRPARYFGIDPNRWLIDDAIERELGSAILDIKRPSFSHNDDFVCTVFDGDFDFVVAQSILTHCGPDLAERLLGEMRKVLAPSGKVIFTVIDTPARDALPDRMGWVYPDCVSYGGARVEAMCRAAGLECRRLDWFHPGAVWYIAARTTEYLPRANEMPTLRGSVLFDPQFQGSRPAPVSDLSPANPLARYADHQAAVGVAADAGIGQATLLGPEKVEAGSFAEFHFRYLAGKAGIEVGGTLRVCLRHLCQWSPAQAVDPSRPGYTTASASSGTSLSVTGWDDLANADDTFHCMFPWQYVIDFKPLDRPLTDGDTVDIVYGNRAGGGPGARVQFFEDESFAFRVYVDPTGTGSFLPLAPDLAVPVVGGALTRLSLVTPSNAVVGQPTRLLVRAEDRYGNIARGYRGPVSIEFDDGIRTIIRNVMLTEAEAGILWIEDLRFKAPGDYTFRIAGADWESNPVRVSPGGAGLSTFWGELHGHTLNSDGRGTLDHYYDYAARISALDVCAVTDHDFMISDAAWEDSKRVTNAYNQPGRFVTLQAFEWSGMTEVGGDHNVYFSSSDPPIARCRSYFDYRNQQTYHGRDPGANHIEDLYNFLSDRCLPGTVLVIPHYGGRPANPKWHRPELERLVEVFSEHQRSENWALSFHRKGYRLGNIAGGDDHIGRPGYGFIFMNEAADLPRGLGLIGIQAERLTREDVFAALYSRRVYATTGERIVLAVTLDGHPMGSEVPCSGAPTLDVDVLGTSALNVVQVIRNQEAITHEFLPEGGEPFDEAAYLGLYSDVASAVSTGAFKSGHAHYLSHGFFEGRARPTISTAGQGVRAATFSWSDPHALELRRANYTVRVVQKDGALAVSSPIRLQFS